MRAYSGYGLPLGEAFQLRDDVLGVFGDPAQTGKPAGDDLREGKRTYLVAAAHAALGQQERAELEARLGDPALDDAGVERLRALIRDSGALARTEERITALTTAALAELAAAEVEAESRGVLLELADAATRRAV
jgi:geranylgeranyl diphosphate synthase type I